MIGKKNKKEENRTNMGKDLNSILKSAQFLMSEEGQKQIDFAAKSNTFGDDLDLSTNVPSQYRGAGKLLNENKNTSNTMSEEKAASLGIPMSVFREMEKDYGEGGILSSTPSIMTESSGSVLDGIRLNPSPRKQEPIVEQRYTPTPQPQIPTGTAGVDYTIIKAIVEECIKRNIEEIKTSILQESSLKRVRLGEGNKIQLVDNKGNLYESTLEYKKNILKK
jgi:hypothetical protein